MSRFFDCLLLAADQPQQPAGPQPTGWEPILGTLPMFLIIGGLMYLLLIRPQNKERRRTEQMLKALKKNDRVVTIGGVIGTVVNIEPDSKTVTLKVDDNSRISVLRSAVQGPWDDGKDSSASKETAK